MVEYIDNDELSILLKAVCDSTRRSLLTLLCQQGPTRVTDLSRCYDMSLNAISKHIKVLEKSGLVIRRTVGRSHWIEADLNKTVLIDKWLISLKSIWDIRLEKLEQLLNNGDRQ